MIGPLLWTVGLGSLWLGAWLDWRGRSVPNRVWTTTLLVVAPLLVAELVVDGWTATAWRLAPCLLVWPLAFLLWYAKSLGAADAKAVMLASLTMSPLGYWDPAQAQFIPILDALLAGLLITEVWRRLGRHQATPFLVVLAPLATLTFFLGGLLWWPLVWIRQAIS